jgi:hypothetical protein
MRVFRVKARNENNLVVNMCEYVGIVKLRMYGKTVWNRYNKYATAELYEFKPSPINKWKKITDFDEIRQLLD